MFLFKSVFIIGSKMQYTPDILTWKKHLWSEGLNSWMELEGRTRVMSLCYILSISDESKICPYFESWKEGEINRRNSWKSTQRKLTLSTLTLDNGEEGRWQHFKDWNVNEWRDQASKMSSDCAVFYIASKVNSEEDVEMKKERKEGKSPHIKIQVPPCS